MKKRLLIAAALCMPFLLMGAAIIGYQDWQLRGSAPANPASGFLRTWADNSAGFFKCLTSAGASCFWAANDSSFTGPLSVAKGGTGTSSPSLVAGTNVTITGSWPNQTIAASGGGGGGSSFPTFTPPSGSWSWVNQGTASIDTTALGNSQVILIPNVSGNWRLRVQSQTLTPPYTITAYMSGLSTSADLQTSLFGLYIRNSTSGNFYGSEYWYNTTGTGTGITVEHLANATGSGQTITGGYFLESTYQSIRTMGFMIKDDGTHRTWYFSVDWGNTWIQAFQEASAAFISPDQIGFGGYCGTSAGSASIRVSLASITVTNP